MEGKSTTIIILLLLIDITKILLKMHRLVTQSWRRCRGTWLSQRYMHPQCS